MQQPGFSISRRSFFDQVSTGLCGAALTYLLGQDSAWGSGPASPDLSAHPFSDLAFAIRMAFRQASRRGAELSGGAKAALESVVPDKRVLQSAELTILSKSFDRDDFVSFVHHRQSETGIDPAPINQDGAGPALTVVTTFFTAGEPQRLTQEIQERSSSFNFDRVRLPIHLQARGDHASRCRGR